MKGIFVGLHDWGLLNSRAFAISYLSFWWFLLVSFGFAIMHSVIFLMNNQTYWGRRKLFRKLRIDSVPTFGTAAASRRGGIFVNPREPIVTNFREPKLSSTSSRNEGWRANECSRAYGNRANGPRSNPKRRRRIHRLDEKVSLFFQKQPCSTPTRFENFPPANAPSHPAERDGFIFFSGVWLRMAQVFERDENWINRSYLKSSLDQIIKLLPTTFDWYGLGMECSRCEIRILTIHWFLFPPRAFDVLDTNHAEAIFIVTDENDVQFDRYLQITSSLLLIAIFVRKSTKLWHTTTFRTKINEELPCP